MYFFFFLRERTAFGASWENSALRMSWRCETSLCLWFFFGDTDMQNPGSSSWAELFASTPLLAGLLPPLASWGTSDVSW